MKNANLVSCGAAVMLGWLALAGCGAQEPAARPAAAKGAAEFFPIRLGERMVRLQLAVLPGEMERGLMGRRNLGAEEGMIFVFAKPQRMNFWMRNTPTALDIGYLAPDGTLAEVYPLLPFDERTVSSRGEELQFALETNAGWFAAHGVKPGAKLDRAALVAALRARGFEPAKLGLAP